MRGTNHCEKSHTYFWKSRLIEKNHRNQRNQEEIREIKEIKRKSGEIKVIREISRNQEEIRKKSQKSKKSIANIEIPYTFFRVIWPSTGCIYPYNKILLMNHKIKITNLFRCLLLTNEELLK